MLDALLRHAFKNGDHEGASERAGRWGLICMLPSHLNHTTGKGSRILSALAELP